MKKILFLFLIFLVQCGTAFADTDFVPYGSAIVPGCLVYHKDTSNHVASAIFVSNTTNAHIRCRYTFYDENGNDISNLVTIYTTNGSNSSVVVSHTDNIFDLPALSIRQIQLYINSTVLHHATGLIEWTSDDNTMRKAVSAMMYKIQYTNGSRHEAAIAVNGGQIF